ARRSPSHRPGPAAWRGDLDLAHAPALPTGAGQPVVACHRAWLLSVQRLAVLVVGAAHTATQDARGPVGDSADPDAHRAARCVADLCQRPAVRRHARSGRPAVGRPADVGAWRTGLFDGGGLDCLALAGPGQAIPG